MVTVIIPTLNEEATIGHVVNMARSNTKVSEVIVIDDKSSDSTTEVAILAGAKVYNSTQLGKGASMRDGISLAQNEYLVIIDGDINPYPSKMLTKLINPLVGNKADFVKAFFDRNGGRVTELVAKPLLSIFFPELGQFSQPLSGMIAGRKSFLNKLKIPNDYGVDVSVLIDLFMMNARIQQVNIGYIENKSKPLPQLGKMSREVSMAILLKAIQYGRSINLEDLTYFERITEQLRFSVKKSIQGVEKMLVLDMDDTILKGRFIDTLAKRYTFEKLLLASRRNYEGDSLLLTKSIAQLVKGLHYNELIDVAESIPLVEDIQKVVSTLKDKGYIIGIISDSYDVITEHIKFKIGAHFSLANELEFSEGVCTGEVKIPSFFLKNVDSLCNHSICKTNALLSVIKQYKIDLKNVIAVGDSRNDLCMIVESGVGVAFCTKDEILDEYADISLKTLSFLPILEIDT